MKEQILKVGKVAFCLLLVLSLSVCSFSFDSSAANNSTDVTARLFVMPFAEPKVDGHHGYVNLLLQNKSNGNFTVRTYVFSATDYSADWHVQFTMYSSNDTFIIQPLNNTIYVDTLKSNDGSWSTNPSIYTNTSSFKTDLSATFDMLTYQVYFPIDRYEAYPTDINNYNFTVLWAPDSAIYTELVQCIDSVNTILSSIETDTGGIYRELIGNISTKLFNIVNELNSQGTTLDNMLNYLQTMSNTLSSILQVHGRIMENIYDEQLSQGTVLRSLQTYLETITDVIGTLDSTSTDIFDKLNDFYDEFSKVDPTDDEQLQDLKDYADALTNEIHNDLEELDKVDKPNAEDLGQNVDDNIVNDDSFEETTVGFKDFFINGKVEEMLIVVFTLALLSYVLFGKR